MTEKNEILFIGDPWETLDHARDSTLYLGRVANDEFALRCYWATPQDIFLENGIFFAQLEGEVVRSELQRYPQNTVPPRELGSFHSVHWRVDPPVDLGITRLWSLLSTWAFRQSIRFINSPQSLLTWNEKFSTQRFPDWAIASLVSESESAWRHFFEARPPGTRIIAKPSGEAASRGVCFLPEQWIDAAQVLKQLRKIHGPWPVLQIFDERLATDGETRVFVINGRPVGSYNKRPKPHQLIMSLDTKVDERPDLALSSLSTTQSIRATEIAHALIADGVYFATIDFIAENILEINVTSPGLLKWIDEQTATSPKLASQYWQGVLTG